MLIGTVIAVGGVAGIVAAAQRLSRRLLFATAATSTLAFVVATTAAGVAL